MGTKHAKVFKSVKNLIKIHQIFFFFKIVFAIGGGEATCKNTRDVIAAVTYFCMACLSVGGCSLVASS